MSAPADAQSELKAAERHRHELDRVIAKVRSEERGVLGARKHILRGDPVMFSFGDSHLMMGSHVKGRWYGPHQEAIRHRRHVLHRLSEQNRRNVHHLRDMFARRRAVSAWIAEWGILKTCPVRGPNEVTNNFGVIVKIKGVPRHIHQGNDVIAAYGTPVVAPFAGTAVAVPNPLGGLAVTVIGSRGYVYNAHLERYGQLGPVQVGTVIGYVGDTGDAGGPHDHFEWHPAGGSAIDPNPYLSVVC